MTVETYSYDGKTPENVATYEMINSWDDELFPIPELLPKLGVIVRDDDGTAIVFMCADMSNNIPRAFLDALQTNPDTTWAKKLKACRLAYEFLCERLREHGYSFIWAITPHPKLAAISQQFGFRVNMKPLIGLEQSI